MIPQTNFIDTVPEGCTASTRENDTTWNKLNKEDSSKFDHQEYVWFVDEDGNATTGQAEFYFLQPSKTDERGIVTPLRFFVEGKKRIRTPSGKEIKVEQLSRNVDLDANQTLRAIFGDMSAPQQLGFSAASDIMAWCDFDKYIPFREAELKAFFAS